MIDRIFPKDNATAASSLLFLVKTLSIGGRGRGSGCMSACGGPGHGRPGARGPGYPHRGRSGTGHGSNGHACSLRTSPGRRGRRFPEVPVHGASAHGRGPGCPHRERTCIARGSSSHACSRRTSPCRRSCRGPLYRRSGPPGSGNGSGSGSGPSSRQRTTSLFFCLLLETRRKASSLRGNTTGLKIRFSRPQISLRGLIIKI